MFEEEDDPDAAFDETVNSDFNTTHFPLSSTLKHPDMSSIAQETGEPEHSEYHEYGEIALYLSRTGIFKLVY
jgi:hypothetical protein